MNGKSWNHLRYIPPPLHGACREANCGPLSLQKTEREHSGNGVGGGMKRRARSTTLEASPNRAADPGPFPPFKTRPPDCLMLSGSQQLHCELAH